MALSKSEKMLQNALLALSQRNFELCNQLLSTLQDNQVPLTEDSACLLAQIQQIIQLHNLMSLNDQVDDPALRADNIMTLLQIIDTDNNNAHPTRITDGSTVQALFDELKTKLNNAKNKRNLVSNQKKILSRFLMNATQILKNEVGALDKQKHLADDIFTNISIAIDHCIETIEEAQLPLMDNLNHFHEAIRQLHKVFNDQLSRDSRRRDSEFNKSYKPLQNQCATFADRISQLAAVLINQSVDQNDEWLVRPQGKDEGYLVRLEAIIEIAVTCYDIKLIDNNHADIIRSRMLILKYLGMIQLCIYQQSEDEQNTKHYKQKAKTNLLACQVFHIENIPHYQLEPDHIRNMPLGELETLLGDYQTLAETYFLFYSNEIENLGIGDNLCNQAIQMYQSYFALYQYLGVHFSYSSSHKISSMMEHYNALLILQENCESVSPLFLTLMNKIIANMEESEDLSTFSVAQINEHLSKILSQPALPYHQQLFEMKLKLEFFLILRLLNNNQGCLNKLKNYFSDHEQYLDTFSPNGPTKVKHLSLITQHCQIILKKINNTPSGSMSFHGSEKQNEKRFVLGKFNHYLKMKVKLTTPPKKRHHLLGYTVPIKKAR